MIATTAAYGLRFSDPVRDRAVGPCPARHGEFGRIDADLGAFALPVARRARAAVAIAAPPRLADVLAAGVQVNGLASITAISAAAAATARYWDHERKRGS